MSEYRYGIIILAAGISRRFNGNKLTTEYKGRMLFRHTFDMIAGIECCPVYVVTSQDLLKEEAEKLGFSVVKNDQPERGISLSLRLGLDACMQDYPGISGALFCVCDQPNLKMQTIKKILRKASENPGSIIRLRSDNVCGNPCLWDRSYFDELMQLSGDKGGRQIMGRHKDKIRYIDVPADELSDIDYRTDL